MTSSSNNLHYGSMSKQGYCWSLVKQALIHENLENLEIDTALKIRGKNISLPHANK